MSYGATLVMTDTIPFDEPQSALTPAEAWDSRRRRLRESGVPHQADRHALTLSWTEEHPVIGGRRDITMTFGGAS